MVPRIPSATDLPAKTAMKITVVIPDGPHANSDAADLHRNKDSADKQAVGRIHAHRAACLTHGLVASPTDDSKQNLCKTMT